MLNFFPSDVHAQLYGQLALNLRGIVSQRLIPRIDGAGRVAAIEIMLNTPRVADLISKGEIAALKGAIEDAALDGSCSFDQALFELFRRGQISQDEALRQADSANNLRVRIKMAASGEGAGDKPKFALKQEPIPEDWTEAA